MTDPSPSLEEQRHAHWDAAYRSRVPELMTWYQERPERSLSFIAGAGLDSSTTVVDVGGGSSPLVDHLFDRASRISRSSTCPRSPWDMHNNGSVTEQVS